MKKTIISLSILLSSFFIGSIANAIANTCDTLSFRDGNICIDFNQNNDLYTLNTTISSNSSAVALKCEILLPNNKLYPMGSCDGSFTYNGNGTVKLYARLNNEFKILEKWISSSDSNVEGSLNNFYISYYPYTTARDQRIDITIRARDNNNIKLSDYRGTVRFRIEKRVGSYRQTASYTDYDLDEYSYSFSSSDNGEKTLYSQIKFRNNGEYRLYVYDSNDSQIENYTTFNIGSNSTYQGTLNNFYLYSYPYTKAKDQWNDLTIRARDNDNDTIYDYRGTVRFRIEKRVGSYRQTASYTDYDLEKYSYSFSSSDNGEKTLYSLVKFRNEGEYRLYVYDSNDSQVENYTTFNIGSTPYSTYGFSSNEITKINGVYKIRPNLMNKLKTQYPNLKNNSTWQRKSDDFYKEMENIVNNRTSIYKDYTQFYNGFLDWNNYTLLSR